MVIGEYVEAAVVTLLFMFVDYLESIASKVTAEDLKTTIENLGYPVVL
ncbi:hypothetical protein GCM10008983_12630 [Lentibacillus halophilus]|uniref:Uncharacterized protein n=1 Tax=Lentibacillus halophilus TaxID=295065 RepID=A0ABN0Z7M8_9BACI